MIPTLNEAGNLPHVLPRIPGWIHELIVVDGLSHDDTVAVAKTYAPRAKVLMVGTRGKGAALRAGFEEASGDIIVMLDADGSTDPQEISAFVGLLIAGADVAMGSRFAMGGGTDDMERHRRMGNWALTRLVRLGFKAPFSDLCYGYTAFWRDVLPVLDGPFRGFEVETVMHIRAVRAGLRVAEVPSFEARPDLRHHEPPHGARRPPGAAGNHDRVAGRASRRQPTGAGTAYRIAAAPARARSRPGTPTTSSDSRDRITDTGSYIHSVPQ